MSPFPFALAPSQLPSPDGVAPASAMDFPSQYSDADFEGDSDDSDLGARHSPAPGPAHRQRFSDQLQRHVLWSALGDHIRRREGADLRASTNRFRAIQSRQAQMPPQGIQRPPFTERSTPRDPAPQRYHRRTPPPLPKLAPGE